MGTEEPVRSSGRSFSMSLVSLSCRGGTPFFRPQLENLEDRVVLASPTVSLPLQVGNLAVLGTGANRQLAGLISLAGQAAQIIPITLTTEAVTGSAVPILNIHLDPIHLNLLGLHVDTSAICLDVTAHPGQGLLGDLLGGLGGGVNLGGILDKLTGQLDQLLGQLDGLIDGALSQPMTVTGVLGTPVGGGTAAQDAAFSNILNLSLGPVDLTLLGLNVHLDNCADGPVTVDVTADPNGGLLGSLLSGLADKVNLTGDLTKLIGRIDNLIDGLTNLTKQLDNLPNLSKKVDKLIDQLEKVVDRLDKAHNADLKDLLKAIDQLEKLIDGLKV